MAAKVGKVTGKVFLWEGFDRSGRKVKGEITCANANAARAALRRQGFRVGRVSRKGSGSSPFFLGARVTPGDIALFARQLATMLKAGVPLVQSFDIVAGGMDKKGMREVIVKVRDQVSSGNSFANAIRRQPEHFDDFFCNLVDAGEQAGSLEIMLGRIATCKEKTEALKSKTGRAMHYPVAVVVVAGVVTTILLVKVVPQFEEIFAGFGADLPVFTRMVVDLSRFMQAWWFAGVAALAMACFAYKAAHRRYRGLRDRQERLLLKLPIIGNIIDKSCVARFARTLSTTLAAGVPLVEALDSVAGTAGNIVYREAITRIREDVSTGLQLNRSMKQTNAFPHMVTQMVAIGEESGTLDGMLARAASHYEDMVDNAVEGLTSLIEPLVMSVLGLLIGGLITAMYLPIFSMGETIGGG